MPSRRSASPSTTAERERYWLQHLQSAETQGATLAAYAKAEQLHVRQLYDWKRVLGERGLLKQSAGAKRKGRSNFVAITSPSQATPAASTALTVKLAQGAELQFHRPLDPEQLSALLQALGASA